MAEAKYPTKTKEGKCIFCELAKGIGPYDSIFWEDDKHYAIVSGWPNTKGFSLVIPKDHYGSDVLGMPDDRLQEFILAAKKVASILMEAFDDVGRVGLIMEGMGINHAHIKLFPMHGTEDLKNGIWKPVFSKTEKFFEKYEGFIASNDGPKADDKELDVLIKRLREISKFQKR
jgi:diadenosine tetraphosphate (Ap4A) HIT family hydrolase